MDRREHHRAQLRLPVRIRWNTPFGQKTEVCKTLDISRGGLLAPCQETHAPGVPLWVTFPYDSSMGDGQPEMAAKVVRVTPVSNGNGKTSGNGVRHERAVALHFAPSFHPESNGNGHAKEPERRGSPRRALALPVPAGPGPISWFEEERSSGLSAPAVRVLCNRRYQEGAR